MKKYQKFDLELIYFTAEDVITASGDEALKNANDDVVEDFFTLTQG